MIHKEFLTTVGMASNRKSNLRRRFASIAQLDAIFDGVDEVTILPSEGTVATTLDVEHTDICVNRLRYNSWLTYRLVDPIEFGAGGDFVSLPMTLTDEGRWVILKARAMLAEEPGLAVYPK